MFFSWASRVSFLSTHSVLYIILVRVTKNNLLALIPWLSAEWSVSLKVRLYDEDTSYGDHGYCNIAEFKVGGNGLKYGSDTLIIMMGKAKFLRIVSKSIHDQQSIPIPSLVVDQPVHIEVHQRYIYGGKYRYTIDVDGVNYASKVVTDAQQYFDVKVYASENNREACHIYVSDFKLTNFL